MDWKLLRDTLDIFKEYAEEIDEDHREEFLITLEALRKNTSIHRLRSLMISFGVKYKEFLSPEKRCIFVDSIFDRYDDLYEAPKLLLKNRTIEFFSQQFPGSVVLFKNKVNGAQLGQIVTVEHLEKKFTFYVKTHRGGDRATWITSIHTSQPVQGSEVFVYKFLELMKIGPQVHFFFDSAKDFYIATLDVGDNQIENQDIASRLVEIEKLIDSEDNCSPSAEDIMVEFSKLDLISRFCGLTDVVMNRSNFGFVSFKTVIIDFLAGSAPIPGCAFRGFLEGKGRNYYILSKDPIIKYLFCTRSLARRKQTARRALQELGRGDLDRAADEARLFTTKTLSMFLEEEELFYLEQFVEGVKETIQRFEQELEREETE